MFNLSAFTAIKTVPATCSACFPSNPGDLDRPCVCDNRVTTFKGGMVYTRADGTSRYYPRVGAEHSHPVYQAPEQDHLAALMAMWVR